MPCAGGNPLARRPSVSSGRRRRATLCARAPAVHRARARRGRQRRPDHATRAAHPEPHRWESARPRAARAWTHASIVMGATRGRPRLRGRRVRTAGGPRPRVHVIPRCTVPGTTGTRTGRGVLQDDLDDRDAALDVIVVVAWGCRVSKAPTVVASSAPRSRTNSSEGVRL